MPLTISSLFKLFTSVALTAGISGCQTASEQLESRLKVGEPVIRVFNAKYEEVETALKQAMLKYPQRVDNTEAGIFETDYVKGEQRFKPPHKDVEYSSGYRYRLMVRLVRGRAEERAAVKVVIVKNAEMVRDFFSEAEPVPSDGLEENVILYRIGRELTVNRALQKAADKTKSKQPIDEGLPE